jgi:hypothetical protein
MEFEKFDILKRRLRVYANVNAYDLGALKANLETPANAAFLATFRAELEEAMAGGVFTPAEFEALTGDAFEDEAELTENLRGVHAFLFLGGPHP